MINITVSILAIRLTISDSRRPMSLAVSAKASCLRALPAVSILGTKALINDLQTESERSVFAVA